MKRSLKLGSHILHESVLPNTWYLVFATCNQTIILSKSTYAVSMKLQELLNWQQHYRAQVKCQVKSRVAARQATLGLVSMML